MEIILVLEIHLSIIRQQKLLTIFHCPHVPIEFSEFQPETTGRCSFKRNSHTDSRVQNTNPSGCPVEPLSNKMQFLIISDNKKKQGGYKHSRQGLGPISETSRLLFRVFWRRGLLWNRELELCKLYSKRSLGYLLGHLLPGHSSAYKISQIIYEN